MFILKKGHQPGVYVPLRALFLVSHICVTSLSSGHHLGYHLEKMFLHSEIKFNVDCTMHHFMIIY